MSGHAILLVSHTMLLIDRSVLCTFKLGTLQLNELIKRVIPPR